ncbi:FtsQ-type POTRA domain-containing protein, partial [Patescibacteria group bacterium]|nr:FtsQ-type POTRA domain-containing protein [Patescibacteria group bacterium]
MPSIKWPNYRMTRFFIAAIIVLIVTAVILYTIMYGFEVKRIEFLGEGMKAEINDQLITGNIIFFPSEKIRQELLRTYPILQDVVIRKKFPHTITIAPILRQPFALLVT